MTQDNRKSTSGPGEKAHLPPGGTPPLGDDHTNVQSQPRVTGQSAGRQEPRGAIGGTGSEPAAGHDEASQIDKAKSAAHDAGDAARQKARHLRDEMKEKAADLAAEQKARAAGKIKDLGESLDRAAEKLEDEDDRTFARIARGAAEQLQSFSQTLEGGDLSGLGDKAGNLARQRPAVFLGAAFLGGVALGQFLSSSTPSRREREPEHAGLAYPAGQHSPEPAPGAPRAFPRTTGHADTIEPPL